MKKALFTLFLLIALSFNSFASHVMGGDITYTCLGGNVYEVTLTLYRDCSGATIGTSPQTVNFTSSCGSQNIALPWISTTDTSQLCSSAASTCSGGSQPGTEQIVFTGQVTLPPCADWIMNWDLCCRNAAITNLVSASSQSLYIQTTMNSVAAACNNSPQFLAIPTPYLCANNLAIYNHGASDIDGDSLYYTFSNPLTTPGPPGTPIAFSAGYSLLQPMLTTAGINLDQTTGEMCFTPSQAQVAVVSVLIQEFRNGVLIGSIIREMQVVVVAGCTNQNPSTGVGATCGGTGGMTVTQQGPTVTQIDANSLVMCPNDNVCFEIVFSDPDGDNITVSSNVATAIPGATFTIVNNGTPSPIATFCWAPTPLDSGLNVFAVIAQDDACPVSGTQTFTYDITIFDQPYAGPDQIICGNQSAQLIATGGAGYVWSVITGDPIIVGTNFSCTNCTNPTASPAITTTYLLTSTLSAACINTDTITIKVVSDYSLILTQSDTGICLGETVDFSVSTTPSGNYNFYWQPAGIMNTPNAATTTGTFSIAGTNTIIVNVDTNGGCIKTDTLFVNVSASVAPNVSILTPDTTLTCVFNLPINLDLGGGIPTSCGPSTTTTCSGASTQTSVGSPTGANSTTSYPAPYANWYKNAKHQFLYTAAELNAMGITGGKITEIAWEVTAINGTTTYNSYQMKMGCTATTSLTAWETGLTQVLNPVTVNVVVGMNVHVLDVAYEWDGLSNLVIEICYDNLASAYTNNSITPWVTTTFNSSLYFRNDVTPACPELSSTTSTNRPVTRFTTCPTIPDPNIYSFSWSPGTTLNDSTLQNPIATPNGLITYIVTVTDTLGGCFDTDTLNVNIACCITPTVSFTNVTCGGGNDGQIIASATGGNPNFIIEFYDSLGTTLLQTTTNVLIDSLNNITAGTYIVFITDTVGCTTRDTIVITEPIPLVISGITSDTTVCINATTTLFATTTGGTAPITLNWDNGLIGNGPHTVTSTNNTIYHVTAVDLNGCTVSDSIWVLLFDTIVPPIITSNAIIKDSICSGDSIVLSVNPATGGSGSGYTYDWINGSNNLIGSGLTITVSPSFSGEIFSVIVGDDCTTPKQTVTIPIYWAPILFPSYTADTLQGCFPITTNFVNTTPNSNLISQVIWDFGDGISNTSLSPTITHSFNSAGCYDVNLTVTSIYGCVTDTIMPNLSICAYSYPIADFSISPQPTDYLNTEITFTNESYGNILNALNNWTFNSGSPATSTNQNPIVVFPSESAGVYTVELIVTNQYGCQDSRIKDVIINGLYLFYVPNSFSPFDGNNINDTFRPFGEGIDLEKYRMQIFDRWGKLIFESNAIDKGWDGTYKGKLVPTGTYIWKITTKELEQNKYHDHYGHVNLIH